MVIKTDTCAFSEFRIYPGHGMRFVRRDGTQVIAINSKCKSLINQRKKPAKLTWTQAWRRLNKKIKVEEVTRRRTRRTTKFQKAVMGMSLEEIKAKRTTLQKKVPSALRAAAAAKEIKDRKATATTGSKPKPTKAQTKKDKPIAARPQAVKAKGHNKGKR
mmetsp:Transcript_20863/g.30938  ORF Transcript_20863/g.30938 Transcript_20863/m.30938 type:complete len:160 (-) Transcript_20863:154-633(-)